MALWLESRAKSLTVVHSPRSVDFEAVNIVVIARSGRASDEKHWLRRSRVNQPTLRVVVRARLGDPRIRIATLTEHSSSR
jgi:hypothetical protein